MTQHNRRLFDLSQIRILFPQNRIGVLWGHFPHTFDNTAFHPQGSWKSRV